MMKAIIESMTRLTPAIFCPANIIGTRPEIPIDVSNAPTDMLLMFMAMLSRNETFFTRPVLFLTKTFDLAALGSSLVKVTV